MELCINLLIYRPSLLRALVKTLGGPFALAAVSQYKPFDREI